MHKYFLIIAALFSINCSFAQAPYVLKEETVGGLGREFLYSVCRSADGTILLAGYSNSDMGGDKSENGLGNDDYWVVKLDTNYQILNQRTLGGNSLDDLWDALPTPDGGYILAGTSHSNVSIYKSEPSNGGDDIWMVKLNADLSIEWENTIGGSESEILYSVLLTPDGGYLLGASSGSPISGDKTEDSYGLPKIWLIKLNSDGEIVWQNTIQTNGQDYLQCMTNTADGGYCLGAYSFSPAGLEKIEGNYGGIDIWVLRLDSNFNIMWQNTIGGNGDDAAYTIKETSDGGFILAGFSGSDICADKSEPPYSINADYWILKLNAAGTIEWENTMGEAGADVGLWGEETSDGNFIIAGLSWSDTSDEKSEHNLGDLWGDCWIVLMDTTGTVIWDKTIGGTKNDTPSDVIETAPGKFIIGGYSSSDMSPYKHENAVGGYDYWIMNVGPCVIDATVLTDSTSCYGSNDGTAAISINDPDMYTLEWNTSPPQFGITATGLFAGEIEITATTYYGCAQTFSAIVPQPDPILINATTEISVCLGDTFLLGSDIIITGNPGPFNYYWFQDLTLISTDSIISVSILNDKDFNLMVTAENGCQGIDTFHCIVSADFAFAGNDTTICSATSTLLFASGGVDYLWNPAIFLDDATISNPLCSPLTSMGYEVTVIDSIGCTDIDSVIISLFDYIPVTGGPDTALCENNILNLFSSDGVSHEWIPSLYLDDNLIQSPDCSPLDDIIYTVFITDTNGCVSNDSVFINVNEKPEINAGSDVTICMGDSTLLVASGGLVYSWDPELSPCGDCDSVSVHPTSTTTYIVTGTDVNSCDNVDTVVVNVTICNSIFDLPLSAINLFPNPVLDQLKFILPLGVNAETTIYDIMGNEILLNKYFEGENVLDVHNFDSGIYFIRFNTSDQSITKSFVKI
ncbi:MAG: T9SS type A sorting domain-containing protein [Chitinophagales bacterium]